MPAFFERIIRSRRVRLGLSLVLIGIGAWAFFPHVTSRVAPSAFVNAELLRVSAPIAGKLSDDLPRTGTFFNQLETVRLIDSRVPDRRQLLDLDRQFDIANSKAELARAQLGEIASTDAALAARLQTFQTGMMNRLKEELNEVTAEKTGCRAESKLRRDIGSRMTELAKSGLTSEIRSAEAMASQEANATKCEMAESRFQRLQAEFTSARSGIYLRDGINDVPYSQQQRDRLMLRRQELESQVLAETTRADQIKAQIAAERHRMESTNHYDLSVPADHVVWSVAASAGSSVTEGQTVLDLADCGRRFLVVELPERDFEQIKTGDPASIRLIGGNEWREGKIRQMRGSAARSDDRLLAAQIPHSTANNIQIEVDFPRRTSTPGQMGLCDIGRLAEVRFNRTEFGLTERLSKLFEGWKGKLAGETTAANDASE
jgi:multidrug efflux pump subunit AcrA (membrane-fusion protein)